MQTERGFGWASRGACWKRERAIRLIKAINVDEERSLANEFQIRSIPTMILFKDGKPVDAAMGAMPKPVLACVHGAVCLVTTFRPEQFPCVPPAPDLIERSVDASIRGLLKA